MVSFNDFRLEPRKAVITGMWNSRVKWDMKITEKEPSYSSWSQMKAKILKP